MKSAPVLARDAVRSLLAELAVYPKPGLVSPIDSGSHRDMDAALLQRSALSLESSFEGLARAGVEGANFSRLAEIGRSAEARMLESTRGVNTHRGAIFSLGLLVATMARMKHNATASDVRRELLSHWGRDLESHHLAGNAAKSHGAGVRRSTGAGGARAEAAAGFPSLFEHGLPHFSGLLADGVSYRPAAVETLFVLILSTSDTNLLHRGGAAGAERARRSAAHFLDRGGIRQADWEKNAWDIHRDFVAQNLSPGGAADLLAAVFFLHAILTDDPNLLMDIPQGLSNTFGALN